tara:strand:- start:55 stop:267 length:213 start_codon:yes stop_codon:yes gene_type:complete
MDLSIHDMPKMIKKVPAIVRGPGGLSIPMSVPRIYANSGYNRKLLETTSGEKNNNEMTKPPLQNTLQNIP